MKIKDFSVGIRLAGSFSLILVLVMFMTVTGVGYLYSMLTSTDRVTEDYLLQERMAHEWQTGIESNGALGLVLLTSGDPDIRTYAQQRIEKTAARVDILQDKFNRELTSEQGIKLLKTIGEKRQVYADTLVKAFQISEQGDRGALNNFIRSQQLPIINDYIASLQALVEYEKTRIDKADEVIDDNGTAAILTLIITGCMALLLGGVLAWLITRSITCPLISAVRIAREVAEGNLCVEIKVDSQDQLGQLMQALRDMCGSLSNTVREVRQGADNIALTAAEISSGNTDLSARTEEQAAGVEQTAATLEQLTATINNTAGNTAQVYQFVTETTAIVKQNGVVMSEVSSRMQEIYDTSSEMTAIIQVIDGIAFQTNILALNAAVEAARAGESGRGFAVVAGEVRNLAQRSASAAREIKELIDDSVSRIASGRTLVEKADRGMEDIISNVQSMEGLIDEIAKASREQGDGIAQINSAMGQIDSTTQQNAALVEQSAATAASLQNQSRILQEKVSVFRLRDNKKRDAEPKNTIVPTISNTSPQSKVKAVKSVRETEQHASENWEMF
ncbi:methyl-accepting chemotaxis protein (plasmid) [Escherichia coli]|uniref:methyl-accepting chemotaxis protein n=1 Tax=Escherichia coli TaxID=562 RepID=UPI000CD254F4|nr:methyl-accepting chemotaxis protein [Escherichia coli]AUV34499.1 methyl-accepting chemotaxis protein [Escherichia coli]EFH8495203.1 methyl-accepting chemotaxis protein [Escherichia coli]EFJ5910538.1 HAMP domain-containing protein [Escherichia coli]EFJ8793274.1 HAMP domain-containing protein [Escherichia coli]EFL8808769.1 HAMP domain-containing protein [Escherichia coli]